MKKIFFLTVFLFIFCFSFFSEEKKEKLVVLDFKAVNIDKSFAETVTEMLITEIVKLDYYDVIERSQLTVIQKELKIAGADDFTDSAILQVGKLAKAKTCLIGSVSKINRSIVITARLIEVETGKIIYADKVTVISEKFISKAVNKLIDLIFEDD